MRIDQNGGWVPFDISFILKLRTEVKIGCERTLAGEAAGGLLRSRGRRMCERGGREVAGLTDFATEEAAEVRRFARPNVLRWEARGNCPRPLR
ncbi:MAG: hypothetical protein ACTS45_01375 [Candidatus Hodgkinia cicadicola]